MFSPKELLVNLEVCLSLHGKTLLFALRDRRLPLIARVLLWVAIAYLVCPVDAKPDFLPGGFSDDSIVTPLLILLGLFSIPFHIFRDARIMARGATCSLVCLAVSSGAITFQDEVGSASATFSGCSQQVQLISSFLDSTKLAQSSVDTENGIPSIYDDDLDDYDDWVTESGERNRGKQLAATLDKPAFSELQPELEPLATLPTNSFPHAWSISRGNRMQLYSSGDDSNSDSDVKNCVHSSFRPPSIKKGGLFRGWRTALRSVNHSRQSIKREHRFPSRLALEPGKFSLNKQIQHRINLDNAVVVAENRWLLHRALLL